MLFRTQREKAAIGRGRLEFSAGLSSTFSFSSFVLPSLASMLISPHSRSHSEGNSWGQEPWISVSVQLPESHGNLMSTCYKCNWPLLKLWICHAGSQRGDQLFSAPPPPSTPTDQLSVAQSVAVWHEGWMPSRNRFHVTIFPQLEECRCALLPSVSHGLTFLR